MNIKMKGVIIKSLTSIKKLSALSDAERMGSLEMCKHIKVSLLLYLKLIWTSLLQSKSRMPCVKGILMLLVLVSLRL